MRNKLIELIQDATDEFAEEGWKHFECVGTPPFSYVPTIYRSEHIADHLIANGVTIQKWIPVEERLPEENGRYLVHSYIPSLKHPLIYTAGFSNDLYKVDSYDFPNMKGESGFYSYDDEMCFHKREDVTHWMPLPKGPERK